MLDLLVHQVAGRVFEDVAIKRRSRSAQSGNILFFVFVFYSMCGYTFFSFSQVSCMANTHPVFSAWTPVVFYGHRWHGISRGDSYPVARVSIYLSAVGVLRRAVSESHLTQEK